MASVIANALKVGNVIEHNNKLWKVYSLSHVKPGKGPAFVQTVMKNIKNGEKLYHRFGSEESVEKVMFETVSAVFLFEDNNVAEFTLTDTFDQVSVDKEVLQKKLPFLEEGMDVSVAIVGDSIVDVILPDTVVLTVISTQPKMKHQSINHTLKPAEMNNGMTISVPGFIKEGDKLSVKTSDGSYIERV